MILIVKQRIVHLEKKYQMMTSLYIAAHNHAKRSPNNADVSFHFIKKKFLNNTAMTNI